MKKSRLGEILLRKHGIKDERTALILVTEGKVFVNGQKMISPAQRIEPDARIEIRTGSHYVGRGALKLEAALRKFTIEIQGKICLDIGSATGGFVQVLLDQGAKKVYAVDTARGKLAFSLRQDPRVVTMEETDIRDVAILPEKIDIIVIDISGISLRDTLPGIIKFVEKTDNVVTLFKPQYETRDSQILKHGIVIDPEDRQKLLREFLDWSLRNSWRVVGWMQSPIHGTKGNIEYLIHLKFADT